jgi:hypothetical protein
LPFQTLNSDLFRPLAGKYRQAYASVLQRLHSGLFSVDVIDTPTRQEVTVEIAEALTVYSAGLAADEIAEFRLTGSDAYAELCMSGWLDEQRDGWTCNVEMDATASKLLEAICGPAGGGTFGGTMIAVLSNLKSAAADPEGHAQGVHEAARRAREFARHMRSVVGTLRSIEKTMLAQATLNGLVRVFFDDFVDRIVIRDYRALTVARNHPYGFKYAIADLTDEMEADDAAFSAMAVALVAQGAAENLPSARLSLSRDIRDIRRSLQAIESFRWKIDQTKAAIEQRFGNTLRYMELMASGAADRFAVALPLWNRAAAAAAGGARPWMPTLLSEPPVTLDAEHLSIPLAPRRPVGAVRHREAATDPLRLAFDRAKSNFDRKLSLTPEKFMSYVAQKLRAKAVISAADIPPGDIEELIVFSALSALPPGKIRLPEGVSLERREGRVENEWIEIGDFVIYRDTYRSDAHARRS